MSASTDESIVLSQLKFTGLLTTGTSRFTPPHWTSVVNAAAPLAAGTEMPKCSSRMNSSRGGVSKRE